MSKTFDLSTLNLSAGTHEITVKARASSYADSPASNAVSYVVVGDTVQVSGTWYFNEIPTALKKLQRVLFTSNGRQFYGIEGVDDAYTNLAYKLNKDEGSFAPRDIAYVSPINDPDDYGWTNQAYRTITFDGVQEVSKEFYDWFVANAVQQTIGFTIAGTQYFADVGMTWGEWVESSYNTGGYTVEKNTNSIRNAEDTAYVQYTRSGYDVNVHDVIIAYNYVLGK